MSPMNLIMQNPDLFDRDLRQARAANTPIKIRIRPPWFGYMPDVDPYNAPLSSCSNSVGIIPRPAAGGLGEILCHEAGFEPVDEGNLPLGADAATTNATTLLAQFERTDSSGDQSGEYNTTFLTSSAGDGSTAGSWELYRLRPSTGSWQKINYASGGGVPGAREPASTRDSLPDWAVMPSGAPNRTAYNGAINEPCFVWCGLDDSVMVYPTDDGSGTESGDFEPLTDQFGADFRANTVEAWNGRLYFGNTIESNVHYRQRIRRTAPFTADPLASNVGAGAKDVRELNGQLLRLLKHGDHMTAYFEDGTAFVRKTDIASAPDRVDLLREQRGLMSKWAVTPIGDQEHFGIFNDGWYILDSAGRWTEVGVLNVDGIQTRKWKETFYSSLDSDKRDRITVSYDGELVRISWPRLGDTENEDVWVYDFRGDRVWPQKYHVTQWGLIDQQIRTSTTWNTASGTWEDPLDVDGNPLTTWITGGAQFGLRALSHGTESGHLVTHDYALTTQYNTGTGQQDNISYEYQSKLNPIEDPTLIKHARRITVEYIQSGGGSMSLAVSGDSSEVSNGGPVDVSEGQPGDHNTAFRSVHLAAANFQFKASGQAPVMIRSFLAELSVTDSEESNG